MPYIPHTFEQSGTALQPYLISCLQLVMSSSSSVHLEAPSCCISLSSRIFIDKERYLGLGTRQPDPGLKHAAVNVLQEGSLCWRNMFKWKEVMS